MSFSVVRPARRSRRFALHTALVGITCAALVGGVAQGAEAATLPPGPTTTGLTGQRPSATTLSFPVSDRVSASVDVATGNLLVTTLGLTLPAVSSTVTIGETYNSLGWQTGSTSTSAANDWSLGLASAGSLSLVGSNVVYTAADGATWTFTPVSGSTGAFTSPAGLKQDLVKTATGYTLTDRISRQVVTFDTAGAATTVTDRNGNATAITYTSGVPASVVSTAGPTGARTATLSYDSGSHALTVSQTPDFYNTRSITYAKDASSNLTSFTDAEGNTTSFGYAGGDLTSITSTTGAVTNISYDGSTHKVVRVDQLNTTAGSPGTSTTRFSYPSGSQTLVAGPDTDAAVAVASVPHITYTINPTQELVLKAVDAVGRERSKTYTPNADTQTATIGATGAPSSGTTTGTYGANNGNSLTQVQAPGGATSSATYGSDPNTAYLPLTTTDDAGNTSVMTFNGAGNPLTSADASGATATLTYNTDGTVATALAPGNGSNKTVYAYTNHQLTRVTPVTGTSLGVKDYRYDPYGRLQFGDDGRGNSMIYQYDKDDRVTLTQLQDGSHAVSYTYDKAGRLTRSESPSGVITNTYDQFGRQLSTTNTAGGGTESYTYDRASNQVSSTDSFGTYQNTFDASGVLTGTEYPKGDHTAHTYYATDANGRRTDAWLQSSTDHTVWAGHQKTSYDTTGRVSRVQAFTGTGNSSNAAVFDTSYCYNTATPAPTCSTGTGTDRSKLQWSKDNLTGQVTAYSYDSSGRLTRAAQSGTSSDNTYAYTYDARGNRLTAVVTGANPSSQTLTYDAANQITTPGYTYDGAGNLTGTPTQSFTYNGLEQMTQAVTGGTTSTYTYAGSDQKAVLTESISGGSTYRLSYGKADANGNPQVATFAQDGKQGHVYSDPITGEPLMLRSSSATNFLYVRDGIGNPVGLLTEFATNAFSYTYDPYGVPTLTSGSTSGNGYWQNPYLFKAGIQDRATGLVKFGARWYNPTTGTWTQQDILDTPLDPANANRYAYAALDPINGSDPTGRDLACAGAFLAYGGATILEIGTAFGVIIGAPTGVGAVAAAGALVGETAVTAGAFINVQTTCFGAK